MLRKIISKLANLTPNVFYYSNKTALKINGGLQKVADKKGNGSTPISLASLSLICAAKQIMKDGDTLEINLTGITDGGEELGNYHVSIHKVTLKGQHHDK